MPTVNTAKADPDGFVPHVGMPDGSDIPRPHGQYTNALTGPDVWPTGSENGIKQASHDYKQFQKHHEDAADTAKQLCDAVTVGASV
jgi:hypothetical protein